MWRKQKKKRKKTQMREKPRKKQKPCRKRLAHPHARVKHTVKVLKSIGTLLRSSLVAYRFVALPCFVEVRAAAKERHPHLKLRKRERKMKMRNEFDKRSEQQARQANNDYSSGSNQVK